MGLRERKKAATRAAIRRQALALIREQGYEATTTEQIAEAAGVSASTFFRYFPTKEEAVLTEDVFARVHRYFLDEPAETPLTDALRSGVRRAYAEMSGEDRDEDLDRRRLMFTVPELRSALIARHATGIGELAEAAAERTGRPASDLDVRAWAGACIGVLLSVSLAVAEEGGGEPADFPDLLDSAIARVQGGALDL
ncbi:TetR family transcriptional regulator [Nocardiopsis sp. HNM0947]|uniref:TetR family transcriptional regulator n=1 Tax=Nocardiopsis coralli TaxID=2772213 RepID=A0ABR9P476_9ACTN|nr:TetR family transcriptional regulator [Nocardiopsis coralli]MBE2998641.1 TetR family transcriptional regulator [Nocardiopsis coralli]